MLLELEKPKTSVVLAGPLATPPAIAKPETRIILELETSPSVTEAPLEVTSAPESTNKKILGLSHGQLTVGAGIAAVVDLLVRDPALTGIGVLTAALGLAYPQLKKVKRGKWALHMLSTASVAVCGAMAFNLYAPPANALFFQQAETFFQSTFALSGGAVSTIFNIFRAIYVVYLIYSAISVWSSYQRDEDWMSVAKAPIVIFIGGTLIDVVTSMIVA